MKSVPPRGSGWVPSMRDNRSREQKWRAKTDKWAIEEPTRYREVVLTSCREDRMISRAQLAMKTDSRSRSNSIVQSAEDERLEESRQRTKHWKRWGPYL